MPKNWKRYPIWAISPWGERLSGRELPRTEGIRRAIRRQAETVVGSYGGGATTDEACDGHWFSLGELVFRRRAKRVGARPGIHRASPERQSHLVRAFHGRTATGIAKANATASMHTVTSALERSLGARVSLDRDPVFCG